MDDPGNSGLRLFRSVRDSSGQPEKISVDYPISNPTVKRNSLPQNVRNILPQSSVADRRTVWRRTFERLAKMGVCVRPWSEFRKPNLAHNRAIVFGPEKSIDENCAVFELLISQLAGFHVN
jgi:hypothetical protein